MISRKAIVTRELTDGADITTVDINPPNFDFNHRHSNINPSSCVRPCYSRTYGRIEIQKVDNQAESAKSQMVATKSEKLISQLLNKISTKC